MEKVKTLGKVYLEKDVLTAAKERLAWIFAHFEAVYLAASGGKDSSVMVQLADLVARPLGRRFDVLYIDMEAQYAHTIAHIQELKTLPSIDRFYHVALPLALRNAVSTLQPKWICWDEDERDLWVEVYKRQGAGNALLDGLVDHRYGNLVQMEIVPRAQIAVETIDDFVNVALGVVIGYNGLGKAVFLNGNF